MQSSATCYNRPGAKDRLEHPALIAAQRTGFDELNAIADFGIIRLVMGLEPAGPHDVLFVKRVTNAAVDLDDDRLLHLVADDHADDRAAFCSRVAVIFLSP